MLFLPPCHQKGKFQVIVLILIVHTVNLSLKPVFNKSASKDMNYNNQYYFKVIKYEYIFNVNEDYRGIYISSTKYSG